MNEVQAQEKIASLLMKDRQRMAILQAVAGLQLPDCFIGAGFLRNFIWDHLHQFPSSPLNDVDVIFFDSTLAVSEQVQQQRLQKQFPTLDFDVKNQARMHLKHRHSPYENSIEAMKQWVELETAIGVRLEDNNRFTFAAPFGLAFLFDGNITANPNRPVELFEQRISKKSWLQNWPKLKVVT